MGMFSKLAKSSTTLSPLIEGKTKLSTEEAIKKFDGIITVVEFDTVADAERDWYPVILIEEAPEQFMFGGFVIKKIIESWLVAFDGDVTACSKALKAEGGVKLKLEQGKTRNAGSDGMPHNITRVTVL